MNSSVSSNFGFLQPDWPDLLQEARRAEAAAHADPRTACFYARRTLELAVAWLYQAESGRGGSLRMPYKADLSAFLFEPSFQQLVGPAVHAKMDVIRRLGNKAVHDVRPVAAQDALAALRELFHVAFWLAQHYARRVTGRPAPALQFRTEWLPRPASVEAAAKEQAASRAAQAAANKPRLWPSAMQRCAKPPPAMPRWTPSWPNTAPRSPPPRRPTPPNPLWPMTTTKPPRATCSSTCC